MKNRIKELEINKAQLIEENINNKQLIKIEMEQLENDKSELNLEKSYIEKSIEAEKLRLQEGK